MSEFIKKLMLSLFFTLWIIYFSNIFLLRAESISSLSDNPIKNTSKNMIHNLMFCNTNNDSYFNRLTLTQNLDIKNCFHNIIENNSQENNIYYPNITLEENEFLNLINNYRYKYNLNSFILNDDLSNIANIKALDIKENKDLNHTSQTLGSLSNLLDKYNILYSSCYQNILTTKDIKSGFNTLKSSSNHNKLLLTSTHIYTGLSIIDSTTYGKIIVQIFIEK